MHMGANPRDVRGDTPLQVPSDPTSGGGDIAPSRISIFFNPLKGFSQTAFDGRLKNRPSIASMDTHQHLLADDGPAHSAPKVLSSVPAWWLNDTPIGQCGRQLEYIGLRRCPLSNFAGMVSDSRKTVVLSVPVFEMFRRVLGRFHCADGQPRTDPVSHRGKNWRFGWAYEGPKKILEPLIRCRIF